MSPSPPRPPLSDAEILAHLADWRAELDRWRESGRSGEVTLTAVVQQGKPMFLVVKKAKVVGKKQVG